MKFVRRLIIILIGSFVTACTVSLMIQPHTQTKEVVKPVARPSPKRYRVQSLPRTEAEPETPTPTPTPKPTPTPADPRKRLENVVKKLEPTPEPHD